LWPEALRFVADFVRFIKNQPLLIENRMPSGEACPKLTVKETRNK